VNGTSTSGGGLESETYSLEGDEVITELTAYQNLAKLTALADGRRRQREGLTEVK
jgi:hypothetical protein